MGEGLIHIITPMSAAWCGWTMLGLLFCAILSEYMQPGIISQAPLSLWAQSDRVYKDAPVNFMGQTLISLFRIGTMAMALCLCFDTGRPFRFAAFATVCGIILAILIAKMVCNILLDHTFMLSRRFSSPYEHYANITTIACCLLFPCLIVTLRIGNTAVSRWVLGVITALFLLMCLYRMIRTYIQSPLAIIYVLLYICTLEVLPLGILLYLSSQTLSFL